MRKKTNMTELLCSCCGEIFPIHRKTNKEHKMNHIKDMYCPFCMKTTKFIEIIDRDLYYYKILNKETLTDIEQLAFDYLDARKEKNKTYGKK